MEDEFKPFKLGLEKIENGYLVTRFGERTYRANISDGLKELRLSVEAIEKELIGKPTVPQTSKPPVGVR